MEPIRAAHFRVELADALRCANAKALFEMNGLSEASPWP
jgi:hypothetical protein